MRWLMVFLSGASLLFAVSATADFGDGLEAYDGGRYGDALSEWRALAEEGHVDAQTAIADMYLTGLGTPPDPERAVEWYKKAAAQGDAVAQLNLGDLYARGIGVERNLVEAWKWLTLAARQGRRWAADRRAEIASGMSADALAEAEKRVAAWEKEQE